MPGLFSDILPPDRAQELAAIMTDIRPVATRTMAYALAECDLRDVLGSVTAPTLVVHGDADERSPFAVAHDLTTRIRGAALAVLPGLGHLCYLDDPAAFEAAGRRPPSHPRGVA